jgi:hypothetical protein
MPELSSGEQQPESHVGDDGLANETWLVVGGIGLLLIVALCLFATWKSPWCGRGHGHGGAKVADGPSVVGVHATQMATPVKSQWDDTRAVRLARAAQRALAPRACPGSNEIGETMPLLRIGV